MNATNETWVPVLQFNWYKQKVCLPIECPKGWARERFQEDVSSILDRFLFEQELMWNRLHRSLHPWNPLKYHMRKKENAFQITFSNLQPLAQKVLARFQEAHPVLSKAADVKILEESVEWTLPIDKGREAKEASSEIIQAIERVPLENQPGPREIPPLLLDFLNQNQQIDWIAFRSSLFDELQIQQWEIYSAPAPERSSILRLDFPTEDDLELFRKIQEKCPLIPRGIALRPRGEGKLYLEYTVISQKIDQLNEWINVIFNNCRK